VNGDPNNQPGFFALVPCDFRHFTAPELPQHGQRERDARVTRRLQDEIWRVRSAVINCGFNGSDSCLNSRYELGRSLAMGSPSLIVAVLIAVLAPAYFLFQSFVSG
jgi:hypothetical protein